MVAVVMVMVMVMVVLMMVRGTHGAMIVIVMVV